MSQIMEDMKGQGHDEHDGDLIQLVTFRIGEEEFGVDILAVQEIIRLMQITMVPRAPAFIEGVINLRGKVIPVISMRTRFNMPVLEHDSNTRIVVMELGFPGGRRFRGAAHSGGHGGGPAAGGGGHRFRIYPGHRQVGRPSAHSAGSGQSAQRY